MSIVKLAPAANCVPDEYTKNENNPAGTGFEYLFSTEKGKETEVITGNEAGKLFSEYLMMRGLDTLGSDAAIYASLPFSIKLTSDEPGWTYFSYGLKHESIWYVVSAQENASIYLGAAGSVSEEKMAEALKDKSWADFLVPVSVKAGDVFHLEPGTIYVFESNVRILAVQKEITPTENAIAQKVEELEEDEDRVHTDWVADGQAEAAIAGQTDVFEMDLYQCDGRLDMDTNSETCKVFVFLEGSAVVEKDDMILHCSPYNTVFVPANTSTFHITGNCKFALVHLV